MKKSVTKQDIVDRLNLILKEDPEGKSHRFFNHFAEIHAKTLKKAMIPFGSRTDHYDYYSISVLGLLNGLFNEKDQNEPGIQIGCIVNKERNRVYEFVLVKPEKISFWKRLLKVLKNE